MKLPTPQAVERKIAAVGGALRYVIRLITPATIFFAMLTLFLWAGGVTLLPKLLQGHPPLRMRSYLVVEQAAGLTIMLAAVTLLLSILAALTTVDNRVREERPLHWHVAFALLVPFGYIVLVPALQY